MRIIEAINRIDSLIHNTYDQADKVEWLSNLDHDVKQHIDKHEGADKEQAINEYILDNKKAYESAVVEYMKVHEVSREEAEKNVEYREIKYKEAKEHVEATRNDISFHGYDSETPMDTVLLVPAPHDIVYLHWLEAQIHYHNGEYDKYNNAIILYNTDLDAFQKHYTRTHKPLQHGRRFLF